MVSQEEWGRKNDKKFSKDHVKYEGRDKVAIAPQINAAHTTWNALQNNKASFGYFSLCQMCFCQFLSDILSVLTN